MFKGGERGTPDTVRDPRGFAMKFYTEEGNWDLVGNNTPIFFMRDPILFPSFIRTQKRNPQTYLKVNFIVFKFKFCLGPKRLLGFLVFASRIYASSNVFVFGSRYTRRFSPHERLRIAHI